LTSEIYLIIRIYATFISKKACHILRQTYFTPHVNHIGGVMIRCGPLAWGRSWVRAQIVSTQII